MKFHILSDIHVDHFDYAFDHDTLNEADIVVVAGDVTNNGMMGLWLEEKTINAKLVIAVPGNHDYYSLTGSMQILDDRIAESAGSSINIFLNPGDHIIVGNRVIMGGTLWTNYRWRPLGVYLDPKTVHELCERSINDYRLIRTGPRGMTRLMKASDFAALHQQTLKGMEEVYAKYEATHDFVVVTHMQPSGKSITPDYERDPVSANYASNLDGWILDRPKIKAWFAGHVHSSHDYMIGECRVVANPRGYASHRRTENPDFNNKLIIEVF